MVLKPLAEAPTGRLRGIDIARGIVMVLMVIDHVRVYAGVPAGGADVPTFLTRWVTHFCAPVFVLLAGTSAFLSGRRRTRRQLSRRLLWRGLGLMLLELTVCKLCWTFQFDYGSVLAGVIWVIGVSMIMLAALIWLPVPAIALIGLLIVGGHNAVAPWLQPAANERPGAWLLLTYGIGSAPIGESFRLLVLYSLVPWVGVMACGYALGPVLLSPRRSRWCVLLGTAGVVTFVLLRSTGVYGDPRPWALLATRMPSALAFLESAKYPASLTFLLMTIGPFVLLLPAFERWRGRIAEGLLTFGRVPMLFYLLHVPLVHLLALAVAAVRTPEHVGWLFADHPFAPPPVPDGYRWSLPLLYTVTVVAVALLWWPCRQWARRQERGRLASRNASA